MSNKTDLIAILKEASDSLNNLYLSGMSYGIRQPMIDELYGFAIMLQDGQIMTTRERKLVAVLKDLILCQYEHGSRIRAEYALKELNL